MRKLYCFAVVGFFTAKLIASYDVTFDSSLSYPSGIPSGWSLFGSGSVKMMTVQPQQIGDKSALAFNFRTASGVNILGTTAAVISHEDVACDNVSVTIEAYIQKSHVRSDSFQVVISTNSWTSYETIGDPILLEEAGRTVEEWISISCNKIIPGLVDSGNDVFIGILAKAGGNTMRYGYVHSLKIGFAATATPKEVRFEVDGSKVTSLTPGEANAVVSAIVQAYPTEGYGAVSLRRVFCDIDRNGNTNTVELTFDQLSSRWKSEAITPEIEAGETLKAIVHTEYTSAIDTLVDKNFDGVAIENSSEEEVRGNKLGSVWINEFTFDKIELCGTTNRVLLSSTTNEQFSDWSVEFLKTILLTNDDDSSAYFSNVTYRAYLPGTFDFTTNMINGEVDKGVVGLETRKLFGRMLARM